MTRRGPSHYEPSPLYYPPPKSTLRALLEKGGERFSEDGSTVRDYWPVAYDATRMHFQKAGLTEDACADPLIDLAIRLAANLRADVMLRECKTYGRPKIDRLVVLLIGLAFSRETALAPAVSTSRTCANVALLVGPGIDKKHVRRALKRLQGEMPRLLQDPSASEALGFLVKMFGALWDEHTQSEKYRRDRAVLRDLGAAG